MFVKPQDNENANFNRNIKITSIDHTSNLKPNKKSRAQQLKDLGNSALKFYESLDMFGKPIILKYNGQEVFKSIYGTTMSFTVLGLMLFYFIVSFIFFTQRKNLSFSFLSQSKPIPDIINFGNYSGNLQWIVGVDVWDDELKKSINDERFFRFTVNYIKESISGASSESDLLPITVPCTQSEQFMTKSNSTENQTYYDFFHMADPDTNQETAICFKINQLKNITDNSVKNITLQGNQISDIHTFLSIKLDICSNDTMAAHNRTCANPTEIFDKIQNAVVRFYFTHEMFLAVGNIADPVGNSTIFYKYSLQQYFSQKYDLFLQQNQVNDYWNIMQVLPATKSLYSFSDVTTYSFKYLTLNQFGKSSLLDLHINADKVKNTYVRQFMNIKNFFVDIVGILNGLWAGGTAIGQIINGLLLKKDLINKNFWIMDQDEQVQSPKKDITSKSIDLKINEMSVIKKDRSFHLEPDINKSNSLNRTQRGLLDLNKNKNEINKNDVNNSIVEDSMISESSSQVKENEVKVAGYISNKSYNSESLLLPIQSKKFTRFNMTLQQLIKSMFPCFKDRKLIANKKIFKDCGEIVDTFFDIDTIASNIREYQSLRNIVLTPEEYKILKMITTPKIEIKGEDIFINKAEKPTSSGENLKSMYIQFAQSINRLVRSSHLTTAEYNLLELHKISHLRLNKKKET